MQSLPAEVASSLAPIPLSPASIHSLVDLVVLEMAQVPGPRCNSPGTQLVMYAEGALLW